MQHRTVTLPDGKSVQVSDSPEPWWTQDGKLGYVHPSLIAPDPNQPREYMDPAELQELTESVSERGVREPIPVTPRSLASWSKVADEHAKLPFLIVTGHRRRASSLEAKLEAVPIRIVVYEDEEDYLLDASILNTNRANLTPIEEGREIVRLRERGVTLEKIRRSLGKSMTHVNNRINLTRLHPLLQKLIDPRLPPKERFSIVTAGDLGSVDAPTIAELEEMHVIFDREIRAARSPGLVPKLDVTELMEDELRFEMQKVLYVVIEHRSLNVERSRQLINEHKLQQAVARGKPQGESSRLEPRKRKGVLSRLVSDVTGSTVVDWTPDEFRRIFAAATPEEVEKFRQMFHMAGRYFADWTELLAKIGQEKTGKVPRGAVTQLTKTARTA